MASWWEADGCNDRTIGADLCLDLAGPLSLDEVYPSSTP